MQDTVQTIGVAHAQTAQTAQTVVIKIGTSSLTGSEGAGIDETAVTKICNEIHAARSAGHQVVLVTSGAIAAGVSAAGLPERPRDTVTLQALSSVGQHRLMRVYDDAFSALGATVGQVLLAPLDLSHRQQYLHARRTLSKLLELGVVPVVNENDATSDDEIRLGDNDRLAALVAHLVSADLLLLLTDTGGLFTADPRVEPEPSLIEEVVEVDKALMAMAGGPGSDVGSGGMAAKLQAAEIASWSGVETVVADAQRPDVVADAIGRAAGVGTIFRARARRLSARKLWIAFAMAPFGTIVVDEGAVRALTEWEASLLAAGVVACHGDFSEDDAVEIVDRRGQLVGKGIARYGSGQLNSYAGLRTSELPSGVPQEVVHRDDLVVLGGAPPAEPVRNGQ